MHCSRGDTAVVVIDPQNDVRSARRAPNGNGHGTDSRVFSGRLQSRTRELQKDGFEVYVVRDATAGSCQPEWGSGYRAALINYAYSSMPWSLPSIVNAMV
jgi:nicotinamidase-related amidase